MASIPALPAASGSLPPCYVLGVETHIGLSVVRELGAAGVPVIAVAVDPQAIGQVSRYAHAAELIRHPRQPEGLAEIRALGERHGAGFMLTVSEGNVKWLIDHADQLSCIRPLVPPAESFAIVLDKVRTLAAAEAVGIKVPRSACPASWAEVEEIARSFRFPAVLKWADPNIMFEPLKKHGLDMVKADYVYTAEEFLAVAARYRPMGQWPLMQEYCAGAGLGQFFYMHRGEAVRRFQHVRVAEWPPEGGFSSVCDGVPLDQFRALQDKSIQLLRHIGWEGLAMVEYRYDPATGEAVLMEVNGRFWGSFPLAMYSGAKFAWLTYMVQGLGQVPALPPLREDVRCRMVATEIKRLQRILLAPGKIRDRMFVRRPAYEVFRFFRDFLRPSVYYYVWSWRDPRPFWRDLRNALFRRR